MSIEVTQLRDPRPSPPSPLPPELDRAIDQITTSIWGKLPIIPNMETGATDGLYFRNRGVPVYGVSGLFADPTIENSAAFSEL